MAGSNEDEKKRDDVLRRMLETPPQPKKPKPDEAEKKAEKEKKPAK